MRQSLSLPRLTIVTENPYIPSHLPIQFTSEEIDEAIRDRVLLGQGGFGCVYKGLLRDGREVAVKQVPAGNEEQRRSFEAEVDSISRAHHRNIVPIFGYCSTSESMYIVYKFVPNNTLKYHLRAAEAPTLNWANRMKISNGVARALLYLHNDCNPAIIHRDIKPANILLDDDFEPRLGDFGLARFMSDSVTHISSQPVGTFGYFAPELPNSGRFTPKTDVFSFGVVLLEQITGRPAIRPAIDTTRPSTSTYDGNLVAWAEPLLQQAMQDGNYETFVDPRLGNDYNYLEMGQMIKCAVACVQNEPESRPLMDQVVRDLTVNMTPASSFEGIDRRRSRVYNLRESSPDNSGKGKQNKVRFWKLMPTIEESGSGSTGDPRSNYAMHLPSSSSSQQAENFYSVSSEFSDADDE